MYRPEADFRSTLPTVLASSVVRSAHPGESHGGAWLVDLAAGRAELVLDYDTQDIRWNGRGAERGLRGIAVVEDRVYLAASDTLHVYDRRLRLLDSFRNRYLNFAHEIDAFADGRVVIASTGFDSVLEFDPQQGRFSRGWCVRDRVCAEFDPEGPGGPQAGDSLHINNVVVHQGDLYVSGSRLERLYRIDGRTLTEWADIPTGTHNPQPVTSPGGWAGLVYNDTAANRLVAIRREGNRAVERQEWGVPTYPVSSLRYVGLGADIARQGFARGLCTVYDPRTGDPLLIAGSSPATISVYRPGEPEALASVQLTDDIRNAVHGLEPWFTPAH